MHNVIVKSHDDVEHMYTQQMQGVDGQAVGYTGLLPVTNTTLAFMATESAMGIQTPWWASHKQSEDTAQLWLWVDSSLPFFQGHFPDAPILPGVVQVHWALDAATKLFDLPGHFKGMGNLKFKAPTTPNTWLRLDLNTGPAHVDFAYNDAEQKRTQGRLYFYAE